MKNKGVIIQGSSRSEGNTNKIVKVVERETNFDFVDLKQKVIGPFDYDFKNRDDDFIPLIKKIVASYDTIIFATPIYWYSMSGILKVFFDRLSDCLKNEKEIGRKLRGKEMGVISCGSGKELKDGFTMPFIETAKYLGMHYISDVHTWILEEGIPDLVKEGLEDFVNKIKQSG